MSDGTVEAEPMSDEGRVPEIQWDAKRLSLRVETCGVLKRNGHLCKECQEVFNRLVADLAQLREERDQKEVERAEAQGRWLSMRQQRDDAENLLAESKHQFQIVQKAALDAEADLAQLREERDQARITSTLHYQRAEAFEAELTQLRASPQWQPIATAPRPDRGRRKIIDVWCVTDDHEAAQFYFGNTMSGVKDQMMWQGRVSEVYWCEGAWRPATGLRMHSLTVTPTHWMPLPAPPGTDESGS